jgi:hypothetical protein
VAKIVKKLVVLVAGKLLGWDEAVTAKACGPTAELSVRDSKGIDTLLASCEEADLAIEPSIVKAIITMFKRYDAHEVGYAYGLHRVNDLGSVAEMLGLDGPGKDSDFDKFLNLCRDAKLLALIFRKGGALVRYDDGQYTATRESSKLKAEQFAMGLRELTAKMAVPQRNTAKMAVKGKSKPIEVVQNDENDQDAKAIQLAGILGITAEQAQHILTSTAK